MFDEPVSHNEVALKILRAADTLMAQEGVQNLSTHKIAKAAGVSVGTIYLYFKDKETLLNQLILSLFHAFQQALRSGLDPSLPHFVQYQQLWRSTWQFMQENPTVVLNMHQYEALPSFRALVRECTRSENLPWNEFMLQGKAAGVIADLPLPALMAMSMKTAWELMHLQLLLEEPFDDAVIDEVITRTWRSIQR